MCQSSVYLAQDGDEELILEDAILIKPEGSAIELVNLFGERKVIDAKIKTIDLLHHKVILTEIK